MSRSTWAHPPTYGRVMGTNVTNPTRRSWSDGYSQCTGCGKWYTHLGIGRHWSKCKDPGMIERQKFLREQTSQFIAERLVG